VFPARLFEAQADQEPQAVFPAPKVIALCKAIAEVGPQTGPPSGRAGCPSTSPPPFEPAQ
jgi:hypothetical protein